ncbi:dehydrogenase [Sphingomonas sp. Sph1(2015)]|jgi:2-desacetyl-2-hydroxyethyl bacteriochlorophyllide A dehydrogenase|uniref:zinc-binding alcohol dehydrogenase family protein n=1 Tax=Sphingomonas sp. Sph1(2015) TaxID=1628084 RepID=UPI0009763618|nr:zinc-binding alcohol dehydrogenase family protein [Sphingomonas sp. Sph1(2015)]OMJ32467.1 dehydrogenase [Sphingomonas sp. Sph1(2015)]
MKALVCVQPHDIRVEDRPVPVREEGEVLIRMRRAGICGTDYHIYGGKHPFLEYPRLIGHELAGEIAEVPEGSAFTVGQVVTVNPYIACGTCRACRRGKPNCCARISVLGVHGDGGMCELLAVPESAVIDAVGLSLDQAAMVEFLAIGAHAVRRAGVAEGESVTVIGAGPIGIAAALFARIAGAGRIVLVDTRAPRVAYARDHLGFGEGVVADDALGATLAGMTGGEMFDHVFDATGNIHAMRAGLNWVAHGGSYTLVGVCKDDLVFPDPEFHKRETTLVASRNALSVDFDHVIASIRSGAVPTDAIRTHTLTLDEAPTRLPQLIDEADSVLKAIITIA